MAIHVENNYPGQWPPPLEDLEPDLATSIGAAWDAGIAENPATVLGRTAQIMQAEQGLSDADVTGIMDAAEGGNLDAWMAENPIPEPQPLTAEEQTQRIRDFGLEGKLTPRARYTAEALDIVMQAKREELQREEILAAAPASHLPATFGAGLVATAIDPINIASAFIPVIGEARSLRMLARAGSAWKRAGVRAGIGATEGAVGAAVIEPLVQLGQDYSQADYGMTDTLLNIGFGAALGASFQPVAGAAGEWLRGKRGQRNPWEVVAPTAETDALKASFADDMLAAYGTARPDLAPDEARQHSAAAAALFDTRARTWAFDTGGNVQEYYDRYRPDFAAAASLQSQEQTLFQFLGEQGAANLDIAEESTVRLDNLAVAREMESAGRDAKTVKLATGWERGADGKWRYETDDNQVKLFMFGDRAWYANSPDYARYNELEDALEVRDLTPEEDAELEALSGNYDRYVRARKYFAQSLAENKLTLGDILGADEVFAAYPELEKLPVEFVERDGERGSFDGQKIELSKNFLGKVGQRDTLRSTLLHEVQHAIQEIEGFARGGSPAGVWMGQGRKFAVAEYERLMAGIQQAMSLEEYQARAWGGEPKDAIERAEMEAAYQEYLQDVKNAVSPEVQREAQHTAGQNVYHRLSGEVEARNVQKRMNMTAEERLASLASETEDVAREDQIFLQHGQQMAAAAQRQEAQTKLARDVAAWGREVDKIVASGKAPSSPVQMLKQTPLIMRLLGQDTVTGKAAAEGGIYAAPHLFDGTHPNMTPEMWKQIPAAMADPIAIFDSDSPKGRQNGDIVFMLEVTDANGATVVVPVALDTTGKAQAQINIAKSAYAKEQNGIPSDKWFYAQAKKNARYVNGQKWTSWASAQGSNSPLVAQNMSKKKLLTEADLVKLQEQHPTLYQSAFHGTPYKFDQFTLDHIGKGEGAQAHGWGLYFAQDRKVANDYRERLRKGRSRGQLFEVDIPENDVLLDEQKSFAEQPEAVRKALTKIYKGFSKAELQLVRDEQKARVRRDRGLEDRLHALERERQKVFNRKTALATVNAEAPAGDVKNPFGAAKKFQRGREYLKELYSAEEIERLQKDTAYLEKARTAIKEQQQDLTRQIEEAERAIEDKRQKERAAIDKASVNKLLAGMDGSMLYSGISIVKDSPRAASEALNAAGVKGITYDGQQDGRCFVVFDDQAIDVLNRFYQTASSQQAPRAAVSFGNDADSRAVINFFSAADASSAPHELYHIFRREMAETARDPRASERVKQDWLRIQEFVGAEPGQVWTREMEEKFARAGERFLLEGKAPSKALQGVFERLRQWLLELYADADAAGLHISDSMRSVFGNMLATPFEQGDQTMRRVFGEVIARNRVEGMEGMTAEAERLAKEMDGQPLETMLKLADSAQATMNEAAQGLALHHQDILAAIEAEYAPALAEADAQIAKMQQIKDVLIQAALCEMRN